MFVGVVTLMRRFGFPRQWFVDPNYHRVHISGWFGYRRLRGGAWTVSHLPTGLPVGVAPSSRTARRLIQGMIEIHPDWGFETFDGRPVPENHQRRITELHRALGCW